MDLVLSVGLVVPLGLARLQIAADFRYILGKSLVFLLDCRGSSRRVASMFLDVGLGTSPQLLDFCIIDIIKMTSSQVLDSL